MEFLSAPDKYYDTLRENLRNAKIKVKEDLDRLQVRKCQAGDDLQPLFAPRAKIQTICVSPFEGIENLS